MKLLYTILFISLLASQSIWGQTMADSSVVGRWKGNSVCQVKNSPCHDELNVYYISKAPGIDSFKISAMKIVNGKEEEMGILNYKLDRLHHTLVSTDYNSLWTLHLRGDDLDGTLHARGSLYRIIKLKKQY